MRLERFLKRNEYSVRTPNSKCHRDTFIDQNVIESFSAKVRDIIKKNKINEKYILNFDETPCFWEYAPKKVLAKKG